MKVIKIKTIKNYFLYFFILLCLIILSCTNKIPNKQTELQYMFWGMPEHQKMLRGIVNKFESLNPDIKVTLLNVPDAWTAYHQKLQTMIAAGTPPDIMYVGEWHFADFAEKDVLLNLESYIEQDKEFKKNVYNDIYPKLLETLKYKGKLFGLPRGWTPFVIYYNKKLFDENKIPYPDETWDWQTFLNASRKLTVDTNKDGIIDQFGCLVGSTWLYFTVWQNNGEIIDVGKNKCLLDSKNSISAIQWCSDLIYKYKVSPTPGQVLQQDPYQMFMTGRVAMVVMGYWGIQTFNKIKTFEWDVAPLPKGKQRATLIFTGCLAIPKTGKHINESIRLLKYLVSKESISVVVKEGDNLPILKSLANSDVFLAPGQRPQNKSVFIKSIEYGKFWPSIPQWPEILAIIDREIDFTVLNDKKSVENACETATDKINKILKK